MTGWARLLCPERRVQTASPVGRGRRARSGRPAGSVARAGTSCAGSDLCALRAARLCCSASTGHRRQDSTGSCLGISEWKWSPRDTPAARYGRAQGRLPLPTSRTRWCGEGKGAGLQPLGTGDGGRGTGRATFRLSVTFLFISLLLSPQRQVRRIYWNCITETCGSQNPQAPRSASCTGRCRAETRTVPPSLERGLRYGPTCVLKGPRLLCWEWSAGPKSGSRGQEESSRGSLDRAGVEGVRSGCIPNAFQTRS